MKKVLLCCNSGDVASLRNQLGHHQVTPVHDERGLRSHLKQSSFDVLLTDGAWLQYNENLAKEIKSGLKAYTAWVIYSDKVCAKLQDFIDKSLPDFVYIFEDNAHLCFSNFIDLLISFKDRILRSSSLGPEVPRYLSPLERKIFKCFLEQTKHTLTRSQMEQNVWKNKKITETTINVHLSNMRKKLVKDRIDIINLREEGYQLVFSRAS